MPKTPSASIATSRFQGSHVYEHDASAAELLGDLQAIRAVGKQVRSRKSKWGWSCFAGFLLAGLSFAAALAGSMPEALPVAGVALVCGIVLAVVYSRVKVFDNARIDTVERLAALLSTDMPPDAAFHVELDMRRPDHSDKLDHEGTAGKWKVKFYTDAWLLLGGRFLDGTGFQLRLATHFQARQRTQRSSSGKSKTKRKTKQSVRAQLKLKVKPERFRHLEKLADGADKELQLPPTVAVRSLEVAADSLSLSVDVPGTPANQDAPLHQLAAVMFLSLYRVLNLSRTIDKSQPPGGNA